MSSRTGIVPFSVYFSIEDVESTRDDTPKVKTESLDIVLVVSEIFQRIRNRARYFLTTTHYINALHSSESVDGALALCWWHTLGDVASSGAFYEVYKKCPDSHTVLCRWIYRTLVRIERDVIEAYTAKTKYIRYKWVPIHPEFDYMLQLIDFAKATSLAHETPERFVSCLHYNETKYISVKRLQRIWGTLSEYKSHRKTSIYETKSRCIDARLEDENFLVFCSRNMESLCESDSEMEETIDKLVRISRRMRGIIVNQSLSQINEDEIKHIEDSRGCHPFSCLSFSVSCASLNVKSKYRVTGGARIREIPNRSLHQILSYMQAVQNRDIIGIRLKCK